MADDKENEKKKPGTSGEAAAEKVPAKKAAPKPPVDEEEEEEEEEDDDEDEEPAKPVRRGATRRVVEPSGRVHRPGIKTFLPWAVGGMALVGVYAYIEKTAYIRMHAVLAVLGISCVIYAFVGIGSVNEIKN